MTETRGARQAAFLVGLLLLSVYLATAAPSLTFWDASEFATAIGTFGIPHPPGTPLYVSLGTTLWHLIPVLSPVQAGTFLSALATAASCAIAAWIVVQASGQRTLGVVAGLAAGAMATVWANATETEVYAVSLFCVAAQFAAAWHAYSANDDRARVLVAYVAALSIPIHLSALVATPAALLLATTRSARTIDWRPLLVSGSVVIASVLLSRGLPFAALLCLAVPIVDSFVSVVRARAVPRQLSAPWTGRAALVTLLAWSAVAILLVRARQSPSLNQGDPDTWRKLLDVVARTQYDVAGIWPRRAPVWLQIGNIAQYADWQVALGLWNDVTPSWWRTPFTVVALALGTVGAIAHWRTHRATARVICVLLLLATLGVAAQLNLRAGPSYGIGVLPVTAVHEARERDYFFALAFWVWGLWIGIGAWALTRSLPRRSAVALAVPALMIAGNWRGVARDAWPDRQIAAHMAAEFLHDVPHGGLLLTAGDNDTYPLWYRQTVDRLRPDVRIVVISLLPANWYLRESAARLTRHDADTTITAEPVVRAAWLAGHQFDQGGGLAVSILVDAEDRAELGRRAGISCWRRVGLVDIGTRRAFCPPRIDAERSFESAERLQSLWQASARTTPDGMVSAFADVARCPSLAVAMAIRGAAPSDSTSRRLLDITCNLR